MLGRINPTLLLTGCRLCTRRIGHRIDGLEGTKVPHVYLHVAGFPNTREATLQYTLSIVVPTPRPVLLSGDYI